MFKISTADTHACSQLRLSFTALSMAFSGKADQISEGAYVNLGTFLASVAACNKTPTFSPNLIIQWIEVGWIGDHSLLGMKLWWSDLMKLETENVKNDGYS